MDKEQNQVRKFCEKHCDSEIIDKLLIYCLFIMLKKCTFAPKFFNTMEFKDILAISSMPGLYESMSERPGGLLVRRLDEKKVRFVSNRIHVFSPLDKIGIYITDAEEDNVALDKVMRKIVQAEIDTNIQLPNAKKASNAELKAFMTSVLPNYDETRVYTSDIKKLIKWYLIVKELAPDALNEPEVVEVEETEAEMQTEETNETEA